MSAAWKRRLGRVFYGFLAITSALEAPAHYPSLRFQVFQHPLAAWPWPMYLVMCAFWCFLWREVGRGR